MQRARRQNSFDLRGVLAGADCDEAICNEVQILYAFNCIHHQTIEAFINYDKHLTSVRPEPVEGLRQAQPERQGVMNKENINECLYVTNQFDPILIRD